MALGLPGGCAAGWRRGCVWRCGAGVAPAAAAAAAAGHNHSSYGLGCGWHAPASTQHARSSTRQQQAVRSQAPVRVKQQCRAGLVNYVWLADDG
jgi:hypothetical protein